MKSSVSSNHPYLFIHSSLHHEHLISIWTHRSPWYCNAATWDGGTLFHTPSILVSSPSGAPSSRSAAPASAAEIIMTSFKPGPHWTRRPRSRAVVLSPAHTHIHAHTHTLWAVCLPPDISPSISPDPSLRRVFVLVNAF